MLVVVVEVASTSVVSLWFSELVTISALETPPKIKTGRPTASIRNLGFAAHAGRFIHKPYPIILFRPSKASACIFFSGKGPIDTGQRRRADHGPTHKYKKAFGSKAPAPEAVDGVKKVEIFELLGRPTKQSQQDRQYRHAKAGATIGVFSTPVIPEPAEHH